MNGRTYYYGLVAYDYGAPNIGPGISPSENNVVVELNEAEEVRSVGKNVAIVTPFKNAAGYIPPDITINQSNTSGGGIVTPSVLARSSIKKSPFAMHKGKPHKKVDPDAPGTPVSYTHLTLPTIYSV